MTGSFCTAVLRKIRLCYWLLNYAYYDGLFSEIANIKGLIYVDEIAIIKMTSIYHNFGAMSPKPLILTLSVVFFCVYEPIAAKLA